MTRIDFYSLEPDSSGDRFLLACRLLERIRTSGLRAVVLCPDRDQARHLDRLLWTFRDDSFLPHGLIGAVDPELTPILISSDGEPASETPVLLNLSNEVPAALDRFERLCEAIDNDAGVRSAGRERFREYRAKGYPLNHHQIRL